jgi:hypothetical protein
VQNENGIKLYERDNFPVHEDIVITAPFSAGNHKANIGFADPAAPAGFNSLFKFNVIVGGMPPLPPIIPPIS